MISVWISYNDFYIWDKTMLLINITTLVLFTFILVSAFALYRESRIFHTVHQLLISSTSNSESFDKALNIVRGKFYARELLFISCDGSDYALYPNDSGNSLCRDIKQDKNLMCELIKYSHSRRVSVWVKYGQVSQKSCSIIRFLHQNGIKQMLVVSMDEFEHTSNGVLILIDPYIRLGAKRILRKLAYSFFVAEKNLRYMHEIEVNSQTDALTGLLNRGSYNRRISELGKYPLKKFGCIYIDVNGLHYVNNMYGHERGDRMLRFIADTLKEVFGSSSVFRIGGDEFVVLSKDTEETELINQVEETRLRLERCNYDIAAGVEYCNDFGNIHDMLSAAEKKMYEDKKTFYSTHITTPRD